MKVYKLTDADGCTRGGTQWGEGITHETSGEGALCGPGWLHFYIDPLLAVLLNPIHAGFPPGYRLWEAKAEGEVLMDYSLKGGCTRLTTLREIAPPIITVEQRVRFALLCAKQVCHDADWVAWADRWLSGEDRSKAAAGAAAAEGAARAVAWAAARAAMWEAQEAAAREAAAREAAATWEAEAATWEAEAAAREAATWAAGATEEAVRAETEIDLIAMAKEAVVPDALSAQAC